MSFQDSNMFRPRGFGQNSTAIPGPLTVSKLHALHPNQPFRPLPPPTGRAPFHLALKDILPPAMMASIEKAGQIAFHIMGDCGGVKFPEPQQIVSDHLERDVQESPGRKRLVPAFLYLLGDVVYFFGAASEYQTQFYDPYIHYSPPIFAIPGNHDGDVDPHNPQPTLAAFVENFCAAAPRITPEAGESTRESMTQPNVYWTLEAPFVTIIGLYSNVPEGGQLDVHQIGWLESEIASAPKDAALLVTMHHPVFSGDAYHSGSQYMQGILDTAVQHARRTPDAVLAGHVHNYQRFTRTQGTAQVPYVVAGAGGYWHLHTMAAHNGAPVTAPLQLAKDLRLESFSQDRHGFMRLDVSRSQVHGEYYTVPRPQESWSAPAQLFDQFTLDLHGHKLTQNGGAGAGAAAPGKPARAPRGRRPPVPARP